MTSSTAGPLPEEAGMSGQDDNAPENKSEAAEREAAKQRLLAQAEAERVPVEDTTRAVPDRRWRRDQR